MVLPRLTSEQIHVEQEKMHGGFVPVGEMHYLMRVELAFPRVPSTMVTQQPKRGIGEPML